jgi:amidase
MPEDRDESRREDAKASSEVSRRVFLRLGAVAGAGVPLAGLMGAAAPAGAQEAPKLSEAAIQLEEATIAGLQAAMTKGGLSSLDLVNMYLERIASIDESGPTVNSILEINPDARKIARQLDQERKSGHVRGPLHGIPVTLKGNIDTGDHMQTTAGSLALEGSPAPQDATVAARLRAAGAVILAKTNLSEWANFRGFNSVSGWSGQGGLTRNPYVLDRNPSGSSSGSAASTSANLAAAGLGTETDGSIISPANNNGVAAIKPTVGLTSRAGVVPISHTQDTVGPHARTVADAATMLPRRGTHRW